MRTHTARPLCKSLPVCTFYALQWHVPMRVTHACYPMRATARPHTFSGVLPDSKSPRNLLNQILGAGLEPLLLAHTPACHDPGATCTLLHLMTRTVSQ